MEQGEGPPQEELSLLDTRMGRLDASIKEKLDNAYEPETDQFKVDEIVQIASFHDPVDLAHAASYLPADLRSVIYEALDWEKRIIFIINADSTTRSAILHKVGDEAIAELISRVPADDAVFILDDVSQRLHRKVMERIDAEKREAIAEIKSHERKSAARLMTTQFFSFKSTMTIERAASAVKSYPGIFLTQEIYVVGDVGELLGFVTLRKLLTSKPFVTLEEVMERHIPHIVSVDTSRDEVINLFERYKQDTLPVIDEEGSLVGVLTPQDAIDALADRDDEQIGKIAGTLEKVGQYETMSKKFIARFPWLFVTLLAGILNGFVIAKFQDGPIGKLTFVLFFIPLITGLSGNIGIQCSTVLVRSMAGGGLSASNRFESVKKELLIGLFQGVFFGVLCTGLVALLDHLGFISICDMGAIHLGVTVGVGLIGACCAGTFLGVFSPLFFARMGIDPAISSGPIITACNDFLSMTIYFLIALGLSSFLI